MRFKRNGATHEVDELRLVALAENSFDIADLAGANPFRELLAKEDREQYSIEEREENEIKQEAISGFISYLFKPTGNPLAPPNAFEVTKRIYTMCYVLRPELIDGWSLDKIAKCFQTSRQTFSNRLIKMNEELGGLRARTQKGSIAVSKYREGTTAWHAERREQASKEHRRAYLAAYRQAHAAELRAYQLQYRAKNRERLNAARRKGDK